MPEPEPSTAPSIQRLANILKNQFGIAAGTIERIESGTATDNFVASTGSQPVFLKAYRSAGAAIEAAEAIEVTNFAGSGGVPVPRVIPTIDGESIAHAPEAHLSVWEFVTNATTAEAALNTDGWRNLGEVVGRLHTHLATHPSHRPHRRPPSEILDVDRCTAMYDELIDEYAELGPAPGTFAAWARAALKLRRSLLPRAERALAELPDLTVQVVHGDLSALNVLMRGQEVAAIIDFQRPSPHFVAWEIARIACDPRAVARHGGVEPAFGRFRESYVAANPGARQADLDASVAVGAAYTLASTYPLNVALRQPAEFDTAMETYGRNRHDAAVLMLELSG